MDHAEYNEAHYEPVENIKDITGNATQGMWVLVEWCSLPDRKDWTWQNLEEPHQDVPGGIEGYFENIKKRQIS